jgi:hypothetical protein
MPNSKGNNNGVVGKKGKSGRKSAFQELKMAQRLHAIWTDPKTINEIRERIKNGTASVEDVFVMKGLQEDTRPLIEIFKKLHPDTLDITSKGDKLMPILVKFIEDEPASNRDTS